MDRYPYISIVVPIFNVSEFIDDCLQSIASQDYKGRIECVLVDDCGCDDSIDHVRRFLENYEGSISFTLISHKTNKGISAARNTGMRHISGDYLLFIDSDDWIPSDSLSTLVKPLETELYDVVVGRYKSFGLKENIGPRIPGGAVLRGRDILTHFLEGEWAVACWNKLYKTSFLLSHSLSFHEEVLFEDHLWGWEVMLNAESFACIDAITYMYRIRAGSIISSDSREIRKEKARSAEEVLARIYKVFISHDSHSDATVQDYIERFRIGVYTHARNQWPLFKDTYLKQRYEMHVEWRSCFNANGWSIGKQIRDSHLAFPPSLGFIIYFTWWHLRWYSHKIRSILSKHLFHKKKNALCLQSV